MDLLIKLIFGAPAFLLAIMIHELSHALAAYKLGDPTARNMGRISLDPRRHFDPIGAIFYVITMVFSGGRFGFGWAKPVIINHYNFRDWRRDFMLSSLAGPVANFVQAAVWALLLRIYVAISPAPAGVVIERSMTAADPVGFMIWFGMLINVVLAVFNLIPIPPLDGSRVLAWILPQRYAFYLDRMERFGILVVFALFFLGLFQVILRVVADPLLGFLLRIAAGTG
jgi:Zn-dependent protease